MRKNRSLPSFRLAPFYGQFSHPVQVPGWLVSNDENDIWFGRQLEFAHRLFPRLSAGSNFIVLLPPYN